MKRLILLCLLALGCLSSPAVSQSSCPYIAYGAVLTAGQWNMCLAAKQDALGFTPTPPRGRAITTGHDDVATFASDANATILWNSADTNAKTEALYACGTSAAWSTVSVVDEKGTAGSHTISIDGDGSDTILNSGTAVTISSNFGKLVFQCDGLGNWVEL